MDDFLAPAWRDRLAANGQGSFDAIRALETNWFEEPSYRRGGWSGVVRLQLAERARCKRLG